MIARLQGEIVDLTSDTLTIEVQGVGYEVRTAPELLSQFGQLGDQVLCYTRLMIRENDLSLYGFPSREQVRIFDLLQSVNGIGSKLACAILGAFDVSHLLLTLLSGDTKQLTKVKGLGKKGAERLVLELRDRVQKGTWPTLLQTKPDFPDGTPEPTSEQNSLWEDLLTALAALGYSSKEAESLGRQQFNPNENLEWNLRQALKQAKA